MLCCVLYTQADDASTGTFPAASITEYCSEVPPLVTQNELIYNICLLNSLTLIQSINTFSSVLENEQCNSLALPFICNATQLFCGDNQELVADLEGECMQIRDDVCAVEWRALENIFGAPLPDCTSFAIGANVTFSRAPPLTCHDEFDLYCGSFCLPSCERFSQLPRNYVITSDYLTLALISISLLGGVLTLIVCIFYRNTM